MVSPMSASLNVLLLEDHDASARLIQAQLSSSDDALEIDHAPTVREGLDLLEGADHDVALVDLHLPGSDGAETVRTVREASDIPIVAVTGVGDPNVLESARRAGARDVLVKGEEDGETLLEALRQAAGTPGA